jgi:hypothetical protein
MSLSLLLLAGYGFTAAVTAPALPVTTEADDPPVRVWFNSDGNFAVGDRAKVYVKSREDGYLVVLRADAEGRVRVLFPTDPGNDQRVTGGKKYEIKSRAGREAFVASDTGAYGTVIAAFAPSPFRFDGLTEENRWDLRALSAGDVSADPEAALIELVRRMRPAADPFEYDIETYVVSQQYARGVYPYSYAGPHWFYDPWWGFRRYGYYGFYGPRRVIVVPRRPSGK